MQERRTEKAGEHCHYGSSPLSFSRQRYPEGCCDVLLDSVSSSQDSKFTDEEAVVSVTKLTGPQEVCMAWHGVEACVCRGRGGGVSLRPIWPAEDRSMWGKKAVSSVQHDSVAVSTKTSVPPTEVG